MAERLSEKARKRALELDIRKVVFKPSLTKIEPDLYAADLRSFASTILRQVDVMASETSAQENPDSTDERTEGGTLLSEFLDSMTEQLVNPIDGHTTRVLEF
jgi:hypothetical protein